MIFKLYILMILMKLLKQYHQMKESIVDELINGCCVVDSEHPEEEVQSEEQEEGKKQIQIPTAKWIFLI
jgi:hypothetical protein